MAAKVLGALSILARPASLACPLTAPFALLMGSIMMLLPRFIFW